MRTPSILVSTLRQPDVAPSLTLADWDLLLRQARQSLLLGHVAASLQRLDLLDTVPAEALPHLTSALIVTDRQHRALSAEVTQIATALDRIDVPVVLLKGAAYVLSGLRAGAGRQMSDIDLLFPREALTRVSTLLITLGFMPKPLNSYDRRYYYEWSHELPPATHVIRQTTLDSHHHIIPPTCRLKPDIESILCACKPIADLANTRTLAPADLVLHSATHLFHDGDLEHGLRDIVDLHHLLLEFAAASPDFYRVLIARARELDLMLPLAYALRYTKRILETPVPAAAIEQTETALGQLRPVMDFLFLRALSPPHASCDDLATPLARWLLYVRSHYLRMPLHLLIPHLLRKAWKRGTDDFEDVAKRADCDDLREALERKAKSESIRSSQRA